MPRTLSVSSIPGSMNDGSWLSPLQSRNRTHSTSAPDDQSVAVVYCIPQSGKTNTVETQAEESLEARIDRLGRERPPTFKTIWTEMAFVFSIAMSQLMTEFFVSGFTVILPTLIRDLEIPQASSVWPATAFSLVIASTLLIFGRLGDIWGGYPVFLGGLTWCLTWSIIAGFSINPLMMSLCRALQGLGAAAYLPTGVMLLGSSYRPGPRKNFVFAMYGLSAVLGFFVGIFVAGIVGEFLRWGWYFWIGAILIATTLGTSIFSVPNLEREKSETKMDWLGAVTIVSGLVLLVFSITESAHAEKRWRTPYIPTLFVLGILLLFLAVYIEGWVAEFPLLPPDVFNIPSMTPLTLSISLLFGTWGIFAVYGTQYFQNIMGASPLQVVAWYTPLGLAGIVLSIIEGLMLHIIPGRVLLIVSGLGALGSQLLLALVPEGGNYWPWIFPATILSTIGIDLSTLLMTVFITTKLPTARQGLAGGIINSVLQLGVALILGPADIIQSYTVSDSTAGLRRSYKNVFWFGVGIASLSLVLMTFWGNIPKAKSELTADERAELEREAMREASGISLE